MKLLITGPFDDSVMQRLENLGFAVERRPADIAQGVLGESAEDADAYVLGGNEMLTPEIVDNARMLRMIVFLGEQPETFMTPGVKDTLQERGIAMESTPAVSTNAVAEMACALILCTLRRIPYLTAEVRDFGWPTFTGGELAGKTLGIYGMGKIGYTVAKRLMGFDLHSLLYSDVVVSEKGEKDLGAVRVDLPRLFTESDVVSLHAPLTPETRRAVGEDLLGRMKPTAVLVNAARAELVEPDALRHALECGSLAGAAFDGYYVEGRRYTSLEANHDPYGLLRLADRFFLTSHQGFNTREAIYAASQAAAEKLVSFFNLKDTHRAA